MAEAFVKTFRRDYVRVSPIPGAAAALALVEATAHPASTFFPNPPRVRSNRVNPTHDAARLDSRSHRCRASGELERFLI